MQRPGAPFLGNYRYYPTKISWTKASGHGHVAVGYTNGFVALYDLNCTSAILKYQDGDGVTCILPKNHFQAHSHAISALDLYHLNGGRRWLLSGSFDRGISLWDLENISYPVYHAKKNIITDGFWMTNWLGNVTACDEGSTSVYVMALFKQARDYLCDPNMTMMCSPSTLSTVAGSDWLNGVIQGNTAGEIVALFPHQILMLPEHHKTFKKKRMLFGYAAMVDKSKTPRERQEAEKSKRKLLQHLASKKMATGLRLKLSKIKEETDHDDVFHSQCVLYEEAEQRYGLLFCDNPLQSFEHLPKSTTGQLTALSKSYATTCPNQYPMTAINKIVFNPNRQASLYYAAGYQAGFVRISWMEFLKGDQQIK